MAEIGDDDMMTVVAARGLCDGTVCFVGIGLPSVAANLARALHAPNCVLVYESGTIGAKPRFLPLSIGDGELAETADANVSVPEIFNFWLQPGRIDLGFLGAAQIDRRANVNTTVIGPYDRPVTRLPGAGGAPEIAASVGAFDLLLRHRRQALVDRLDFRTSVGLGDGGDDRRRLGLRGAGPRRVITSLGVLTPEPALDGELVLRTVHPGVSVAAVRAATGWPLEVAPDVGETPAPTGEEIEALAALRAARPEGVVA